MNSQNQNLYLRGSEWRRWDLHFHTPSSHDYKDKSVTNEEIFNTLKQNNISVVAITDHHVIDIARITELKKLAGEEIAILPGIEICSDSRGNEPIHFIGIFTENVNLGYIWTEINSKAELATQRKEGKKENEIYCNFKKTACLIKNLGGLVSIHAGSKSNSLETITNSLPVKMAEKKDIAELVHIFELGQEKDKQDYERKVFPKIGFYPMVICSDNHNIKNYSIKQNCWIKANLTFWGLKEIIYEPKERVKIQEDNPEPLKSFYSINSIKISNAVINENLLMKETEIPLNRNLVAVIGGKGSGKTALLDLIANCYPNKIDSSNKNSFVNRIFKEGQDLVTDIKFLNQEKFSKKLGEQKLVVESDIEYIPQGQIENKIGNVKEFHNFLQNLIFKSDKVRNSTAYFEYQENEKIKKEIKNKIEILNQEIFIIETQIKNEDMDNINKQLKLKEAEKKDIQNKINSNQKLFTKEKLEEINKIQGKLSVFKDKRNKLSKLHHLIRDTIEKFVEIENLNESLEAIKNLVNELKMKDSAVQLIKYEDIKDQIENIGKKTNQELVVINKNIEQTQNEIEKLQKDKKEYIVLLNKFKEIDMTINSLKNKQKDIAKLQKSLPEKIKKRWKLYKKLLDTNLMLRKKYKEIIDLFSRGAYEILIGIEFKSSLIFDFKNFAEIGEDVLDLRTIRESKTQKVSLLESEPIKEIINTLKEIITAENNNRRVDKLTEIMKQKITELLKIKKSTRTSEHLYEWFFGDYFSLNTEIYFNKIFLEKLSLGQKCTVLLKVYLAQGENPILIDQPDDNLDNEFIMNELVRAIRQAKSNRQVIIATNNANVVINSDAEQIIAAEYRKGEISYTLGAIENPIIKEKAINILEGGREAFEAREKKYDFK